MAPQGVQHTTNLVLTHLKSHIPHGTISLFKRVSYKINKVPILIVCCTSIISRLCSPRKQKYCKIYNSNFPIAPLQSQATKNNTSRNRALYYGTIVSKFIKPNFYEHKANRRKFFLILGKFDGEPRAGVRPQIFRIKI